MRSSPAEPSAALSALLGLCGLAVASPAAAQVEADALRRCRALTDVVQRLACYDAIALPQAAGASPLPSPVAPPLSPAPSRPVEADFVDSRIVGRIEGWTPATRFTLSNGQVWEIADGSQAVYDLQDPGVRITRGLFGSFFIRIEGVSQTPRVRRVR